MNARILEIPSSEYHQLSELSRSQLATFRESPYGYMKQHIEQDPEWQIEVTPAMEDGTLLHSLVLDHPGLIDGEPQEIGDLRFYPREVLNKNGDRGTNACKAWEAENAGMILRKEREVREIWTWAKMLCRGKAGDNLFCGEAKNEQTVIWQHECRGTVIDLRARLDRVILGECIVDLKTCAKGDINDMENVIRRSEYDFQAAMYQWAWEQATGQLLPFKFVFLEKSQPHRTSVWVMHQEWLNEMRGEVLRSLEKLNKSRLTNDWRHPLQDVEMTAFKPKWAEYQYQQTGE